MIKNASATVCDNAGELGEKFMSLYNMKTHKGLDIELHQNVHNGCGLRRQTVAAQQRLSSSGKKHQVLFWEICSLI
jgi:hypothetical protein